MHGMTALMIGAVSGHVDVVRILLEAGSDKEKNRKDGMTALMIGAVSGHVDVVRILLEAGSDQEKDPER